MAYFARKLRYGAHDGDAGAHYFALLELARKKGGRPIGFVLYRRIMYPDKNRAEMVRLSAKTAEEAVRRFWPSDERGAGKEFPDHRSDTWQKTTLWLSHVATGGGHERFGYKNDRGGIMLGNWARVGTPAPWRAARRKRKKPLQIGNLGHLILVYQVQLHVLLEEWSVLMRKLSGLEMRDRDDDGNFFVPKEDEAEFDEISTEIGKLDDELDSVRADIARIEAEMRYKVRQMFPEPAGIVPKKILRIQKMYRMFPW
jgi:hypothetical protein